MADPAFVQSAIGTETAQASSLATTISTTAGNGLVIFVVTDPGGSTGTTVTSISDSGGVNVWSQIWTQVATGQAATRLDCWACFNALAVTSVTANFGATCSAAACVLEASSVGGVDQFVSNAGNSSSWDSGTTATTREPIEVAFVATADRGLATINFTAGWTAQSQASSNVATQQISLRAARLVTSSTGTQNETGTFSSTKVYPAGVVTLMAGWPIAKPRAALQAVKRSGAY